MATTRYRVCVPSPNSDGRADSLANALDFGVVAVGSRTARAEGHGGDTVFIVVRVAVHAVIEHVTGSVVGEAVADAIVAAGKVERLPASTLRLCPAVTVTVIGPGHRGAAVGARTRTRARETVEVVVLVGPVAVDRVLGCNHVAVPRVTAASIPRTLAVEVRL